MKGTTTMKKDKNSFQEGRKDNISAIIAFIVAFFLIESPITGSSFIPLMIIFSVTYVTVRMLFLFIDVIRRIRKREE